MKSPFYLYSALRCWKGLWLFFILSNFFSCETEKTLLSFHHFVPLDVSTRNVSFEDFFKTTDSTLYVVISTLQKVEKEKHFVEMFRQDYGFPLWNCTYRLEDDESTFLFVPLFRSEMLGCLYWYSR